MITSLFQFVLGVSVAFSGNYYIFVVLRFLLAMVSSVCASSLYVVTYPCVSLFLHALVGVGAVGEMTNKERWNDIRHRAGIPKRK